MKTIKINGVEFRVTRETSDTTVDQHYRFGVEPSGRGSFNVNQIIDATAPGVEVSISGHPDAVKGLFVTPSDPHSLIQRALSALGYVVGDHEKDVAQFSQWIDHLVKFPQSEEALGLWTNATLARLHATRSVDEASKDAQAIVIQRMRLFPPAPKTGLDDGPLLPEPWTELHEWRSAAKRCGIESAKELADTVSETFGQFVDRKVTRDWREATGCQDPATAKERIKQLRAGYDSADAERSQLKRDAEQRERAWVNTTDRHCPGDAEQRIDDLRMQVEIQAETIHAWEKETKCKSPEDASKLDELAKTWQDSSTRYEYIAKQRAREISEWVAKSGVAYPDELVEKFRVTEDAWKEATGAADTHAAYKKIADLESKLPSYASKIDALRKNWQTNVVDVAVMSTYTTRIEADRELAKVKAELDSKRRECQTEKERADENARKMVKRGALLDKIAEALGCDFNHDSLPEHVADLKHAHDNVNDSLVGSDDLANETKEIASILVSQLKDSGIGSAAGAIAARSVFLSAVWAKSRLAREILLGGTGESIVDAAKRVMDRCASLEQQIIADDNRTDELRKILHAKEGESVIDAAKRAIIPLPKPEKVEPGQKWAFVMKAIDKGSSPPRVVGTFIDSNGSSWCAYQSDLDTGFYLGT